MTTLLLAVPLFLLAVAGMAVGVLLKRKPICGSCGNCSDCIVRRGRS